MLVPLLKLVTFLVVQLWSLLTRLIFNTIAYTIVLLIQGLKIPGEGSLGIFQQVAELIRACWEFILNQILESINYLVSTVFDILKDGITGAVAVTGSVAVGLAEKVQESLEQVPELLQELADMISNMVTELWSNYKDAVGYVAENA